MFCSECGKEIADNSKFCPECGKAIETIDNDSINKAKKSSLERAKDAAAPMRDSTPKSLKILPN